MSHLPSVSVVMPVHNRERFVAAAIESILDQSYRDFEFIIVDDGSSDRSPEIIADYAKRDARIVVHRHATNQGISATRNQGCRMARGELIAVMDSDDVCLPHRFQTQVAFLKEHPEIAAVGGWVQLIDQNGVPGRIHSYPTDPALTAWSMIFFNTVNHPTAMIRRTVLDPVTPYIPQYPIAADYALFMRLTHSSRVTNLPVVFLHYRAWQGNVSRRPDAERHSIGVLRDALAALGVDVSVEQALGLQGLSRDRYPATVDEIAALAKVIDDLRRLYIDRIAGGGADVEAINNDAAVRLWQLSAVALRRSPVRAVGIGAAAIRIRPLSIFTFGSKVLRKLAARISTSSRR